MIILVHYCFIVVEILDRHYNALFKECLKRNPSTDVIRMYLNEEFVARRKWILTLNGQTRCSEVL